MLPVNCFISLVWQLRWCSQFFQYMHDMHDTFEHLSECKLMDEQQPFRQSKGLWKQILCNYQEALKLKWVRNYICRLFIWKIKKEPKPDVLLLLL